MLQLSGLGEVDPCAANPTDPVCREIYTQPGYYGMQYADPPRIDPANNPVNDDTFERAAACGYNTWWDGVRCQPFVDDGTKSPAQPPKPALASMTSISPKTIAILAALGLTGWLLYKRLG